MQDKKRACSTLGLLLDLYIDRVSYFSSIPKNMFSVLTCKIQTFSSIPDNLSLQSNSILRLEEKVTNYLFISHSKKNKRASKRSDDVIKKDLMFSPFETSYESDVHCIKYSTLFNIKYLGLVSWTLGP